MTGELHPPYSFGYANANTILYRVSPDNPAHIVNILHEWETTENSARAILHDSDLVTSLTPEGTRLAALGIFLQSSESHLALEKLQTLGIIARDLDNFLQNNSTIIELIDVLSNNQDQNKMALAMLLAHVHFSSLSPQTQEALNPQSLDVMSSLASCHELILCESAETRLDISLENQTYVVVNNSLIVKFTGTVIAMCANNVVSGDNTFLEGVWYIPRDQATSDALMNAFDTGQKNIVLDGGAWAVVRQVENRNHTSAAARLAHSKKALLEAQTKVDNPWGQYDTPLKRGDYKRKERTYVIQPSKFL